MSARMEQRAEHVFDILVLAGADGLTREDVYDSLVANGLLSRGASVQLATEAIQYLRQLLSSQGDMSGTEIVPCRRAAHLSTYFLAMSPDDALEYRRRRSSEIATQVSTLIRQVETERDRFSGHPVFTDAALDYFALGIRELERAGAMRLA